MKNNKSLLPEELRNFLKNKGSSLLIKGDAGTGKTTLALEILKECSEGKRGVYLSTRVSQQKLYSQFRWLKGIIKPEYFFSSINTPNEAVFDDLRLGDIEFVLEKVIEAIHKLKAPIIVFDSWDSLAKEAEETERIKTEKTIIALIEGSDSKVIFVSEEPQKTTIDYLVDGIVTLSQAEVDGRRLREIELNKLRGTPISQHKFVFTLDSGRFKMFSPYKRDSITTTRRWKPIPDKEFQFSTGSEDFDNVLEGGYPRGSCVVVEADENVPMSAILLFSCSTIRNFISNASGVIVLPMGGYSASQLENHIVPFVEENKVKNFLRVLHTDTMESESLSSLEVALEIEPNLRKDHKIWENVKDLLREQSGKPILEVYGLNTLESRYLEESGKLFGILNQDVVSCKGNGGLMVCIVRPGTLIGHKMLNVAEIHIKLFERNGSVLLYGKKPMTGFYVLEREVEAGHPIMKLNRVV